VIVDLRSDTVTRPTEAMRRAMAAAPVGDDVYGEDPTVNALEAKCAERSGKEAALFVPSGTMANQIAIAVHTRPGDEVLLADGSHPLDWEAGGAAMISGVQLRPLAASKGLLDPSVVKNAIRPADPHIAPATLVCVEDTSNRGGGTVYPLDVLDGIAKTAKDAGLATHMDGARAFNAVIASGVPLARRAQGYDTVGFCFSKGLGAPVGSVLCGPTPLIARARRVRKMLGGGMRQAGILAAACDYALDHHVVRLAEDHRRARELAMGLLIEGVDVQLPETNLVYFSLPDAKAAVVRLKERGVLVNAVGPERIRAVVHLDVDDAGVAQALAAIRAVRQA
jgi:threonine aldolase